MHRQLASNTQKQIWRAVSCLTRPKNGARLSCPRFARAPHAAPPACCLSPPSFCLVHTSNFTGAAGAYSTESGVSIGVSGFKDNLSNFWSGRWCSTWDCAISGSSADVSGSIKLLVHYFENGNVQFEVPPQKNKCRVPFCLPFPHPPLPPCRLQNKCPGPSRGLRLSTSVLPLWSSSARRRRMSARASTGTFSRCHAVRALVSRRLLPSQAEESFKSLRRKLPKTKQEFNWQVCC